MRPSQLLAALVAMSSVSAAFPDVFQDANPQGEVRNILLGRQDKSSSASATPTESAKNTDSAKNTESAKSTDNSTPTAKETSKETSSGDNKPTGSGSKTSNKPSPTNFGPDVQPGGVNMITPAAIAGAQYYKIRDYVTFVWNYTSLSVTPTAVDVMASCTANQATYTIAVNQSIQATQTVVWDTGNYQSDHPNSQPLLTENYQLMIYDSNSTVSAAAKPGYLSPYKVLTFGMYTPEPAIPWEQFKIQCGANCNAAVSPMELLTLKAMFITSATTIASILYFTASFGVW